MRKDRLFTLTDARMASIARNSKTITEFLFFTQEGREFIKLSLGLRDVFGELSVDYHEACEIALHESLADLWLKLNPTNDDGQYIRWEPLHRFAQCTDTCF